VASTEGLKSGTRDEERRPPPPDDIALSDQERDDLLNACARICNSQRATDRILDRIGFPRERRPLFTDGSALDAWSDIFFDLDNGILPGGVPYWRLLEAGIRVYPTQPVLRPLARRHGLIEPDPVQTSGDAAAAAPPAAQPAVAPADSSPGQVAAGAPGRVTVGAPGQVAVPDACHLIVRAEGEDDRQRAVAMLAELGLAPREVWSTAYAVSYRLNTADAPSARRRLEEANTGLGWTLVPAGEPDYLINSLYVSGPDGRRFLIQDAPAQQSVGNIATEVVHQYPRGFADASRPTVVDHVGEGGQRRRLGSEETLHEAGIQDGDNLAVGFQATAGAVNPLDRQDALFRVRNELAAYAAAHPGFAVTADSALLPMAYQVSFTALSWAPSPVPGGEPELVKRHLVEITLGPEFPLTAPQVTWRSPIFHPNVAPMYDTPERRIAKESRGQVCLGLLAESFQPSLSFGDLCQTLVDLAGYRNYGLVERQVAADGTERVVPNVYDAVAKAWVEANPDRIVQIGGVDPRLLDPRFHGRGPQSHYPNVIGPAL
jgi:ubiquitin-protein ligase